MAHCWNSGLARALIGVSVWRLSSGLWLLRMVGQRYILTALYLKRALAGPIGNRLSKLVCAKPAFAFMGITRSQDAYLLILFSSNYFCRWC